MSGSPARSLMQEYARAVAGLSDPRPGYRVGALQALVMVGQASPAHRPAVMDVICTLLRARGIDEATRSAATRLLQQHLHPARPEFWPGLSVDLSGARIVDLDLGHCRIDGDLCLDNCRLLGSTRLRGLAVRGQVLARGARFDDHAWWERAQLGAGAWFDGTTFAGDAWFGETHFSGPASFAGVDFEGHAWFGAATFTAVDFAHAVFRRSAGFRGAVVRGPVSLSGTTFHGPARVSRRDDAWNLTAPGWQVVVDDDNSAVGRLFWVSGRELIEKPFLVEEPTTV